MLEGVAKNIFGRCKSWVGPTPRKLCLREAERESDREQKVFKEKDEELLFWVYYWYHSDEHGAERSDVY